MKDSSLNRAHGLVALGGPQRFLMLPINEIHIHFLRYGPDFAPEENLVSLLPLEEQERCRGFGMESRRLEFLGSRLLVRRVLAHYLGREGELPIRFPGLGKPFVEGFPLRFNLSHTEGLVACSFAWNEVGIDVEKTDIRARPHWPLLARRYFSPAEQDFLFSRPPETQPGFFFRIFTMKEAALKVRGWGWGSAGRLTVPLPVRERSFEYPWDYCVGEIPGDYCLAHVAEAPEGEPFHYLSHYWEPGALAQTFQRAYRSPFPEGRVLFPSDGEGLKEEKSGSILPFLRQRGPEVLTQVKSK